MNENLELMSDVVTVNIRHEFSKEELARESQSLAKAVQDKTSVENNKKVATSGFNNQIKQIDTEIKIHSDNVSNRFTYKDVTCELYRDFARCKRVYILKGTEMVVKEEDFRESDYQKTLEFDENTELTELDINRNNQIEQNNAAGRFAEGGDALDNVINERANGAFKFIKTDDIDEDDDNLPGEDDLFAPEAD